MSLLIPIDTRLAKNHLLLADEGNRDVRSRVRQYLEWLKATQNPWMPPRLKAYCEHLLDRISPTSTKAHISTIRVQYRRLLEDREFFYSFVPPGTSPADAKALVDEVITRLNHQLNDKSLYKKIQSVQDQDHTQQIRLSREQGEALIRAPYEEKGSNHAKAIRNSALIGLMLATGIREEETCNIEVADLRGRLNEELALVIRHGKGNKQRLIPYGVNSGVLMLVENWLSYSAIVRGPVFQGFKSRACDPDKLTGKAITTRTLQNILLAYPIIIDGRLKYIKAHDLRRTYAYQEYKAGTSITAIQQNLGHTTLTTTLQYIGPLNARQRRGRGSYQWRNLLN